MTDYADRIRKYNRAGDIQYEWWEEVADHIEKLELEVEALDYDRTAAWHDGYEAGKKAMTNKQEGYSSDLGILGVETLEEHEDGSAIVQFHMDERTRGLLAEEGLKLVLYCAAAKLDMGVVYDFIQDHMENNNDD
jgi:hypothetical protein